MSYRPSAIVPRLLTLLSLPALVAGTAAFAPAKAPPPPFTVVAAPYVETPRFVVRYAGAGKYETRYRARPPNPGGARDLNLAHDTSAQTWRLTFERALSIPPCGQPAGADPCGALTGLAGARGPTTATARIDHVHVDGLYRQLDATDKCRLRAATSRSDATLDVRYDPATKTIRIGARNPISLTLILLRGYCPKRPDGIDRMNSNYANPGFSFRQPYGPDRWFRSRVIAIPADVLHRAASIRIPLADTPTGRPPRNCVAHTNWFERCTTGGSWRGTLTLTRTP